MQTEPEGATQWQKTLILGFFVLPIVLTVGVLASPWFREMRSRQLAKNDQLIAAVDAEDARAVEQLLQQGANVNARTRGGLTALSLAVIRGYDSIALTLIERGASLDARDKSGDRQQMSPGYSPVHYAAIYGRTRVLERMLQAGVAPDLRDKNGRTLMMPAAENGHADTVRLLLRHGANPRAVSALRESVLDCAKRGKNPTVIRLLEAAINSPESESGGG